ncbi:transcriptional repressor [Streptomyces armeniacus]|uniref:Transcriptional repressor n=1 Tax=Streptomyces armeniacus TaxID=83291 RepID=A0A345XLB9_9ACTN|nr:transcriptional repressor [Streptomyces armeniacus]AXK32435.1 transcriptional repressor [Streptomyces armeniacus]
MVETHTAGGHGQRRARRRLTLLRSLAGCPDFISAQRLHARLADAGRLAGLSTVYRGLRDLEDAGLVDVVRDETTGERLYRKRADAGHRHYVVCRGCGCSEPVDADVVERWAERLDEVTGFEDVRHTLELSGECRDCAAARRESGHPRGTAAAGGPAEGRPRTG